MADNANLSFSGNIAETYENFLGPVLFEPYARDIASRVISEPGLRVLEIAAGTGRGTRHLLGRLPADGHLVASDISAGMLAVAQGSLADSRLEWQVADALDLPFADASFDVVVCQFGIMFFPDKVAGYREILRVLRPGGTFLFNVWGWHDRNPWTKVAHRVMQECFPGDPDPLLVKPFMFGDPDKTRAALTEAGFGSIDLEWVDLELEAPTAADFARGFAMGTPLHDGILERGGDLEKCIGALAAGYANEFGGAPMRSPMGALLATASK